MVLVHRHRRETGLEQVSGPAPSRTYKGRISPMRLADRARQARFVNGREDEMDMVGHETVGPARHVVTLELRAHQPQVQRLVAGFEEEPLAAVSPLCHVMRDARDGHDDCLAP
jgi:hypothetical protein